MLVGHFERAMVDLIEFEVSGSLLVTVGDSTKYGSSNILRISSFLVLGGYETEKEVCVISDLNLFLLLVSQIFDAFVENSNLFLIILDILIKFLNLFLEFMLLTRFRFKYERSSS